MFYPERLQGTDGIRRTVKMDSMNSPIKDILTKNVITPAFVRAYCFTVVKWLCNEYDKNNISVAIGYDPRDKDKKLVNSAIEGLRKAGADVYLLGITPTPALPIYIVKEKLDAGIMLSASHNPKDQNGIKIFLKNGLKPFPEDDKKLTALFYKLFKGNSINLENMEAKGSYKDCEEDSNNTFKSFFKNNINSWLYNDISTKEIIILLDCANGSYSNIAGEILNELGFDEVIKTACDVIKGDVNENSGVVELEGKSYISPSELKSTFKDNKTINLLFEKGREHKSDIQNGGKKIIAFIFDADGDRFYRAEYDPYGDGIIVLSGDENAILQADFLVKKFPENMEDARFVLTIESDYNVFLSARDLGFETILTGVGDKWILRIAIESYIRALYLSTKEDIKDKVNAGDITEAFDIEGVSAVRINKLYEILKTQSSKKLNYNDYMTLLKFGIGSEESGHNISTGYVTNKDNELVPVFIGNGLKSALNSFASTEKISECLSPFDYYEYIKAPFIKGFKKTLYVYYTDKEKLLSSDFRDYIRAFIREKTKNIEDSHMKFI